MNEEIYQKGWKIDAANGSVAFGSALYKWAVSVPFMKKSGVSFKDVYNKCRDNDQKWLAKQSPLCSVILDMVVHHLPNPMKPRSGGSTSSGTGTRPPPRGRPCSPATRTAPSA